MADINEKVSGIGSMSKRTDLNVTNQPARYISGMPYGEGQATYEQQTAAPMYGGEASPVTEIGAPTRFPNSPITSGIDSGPGPGSEAVMLPAGGQPTILEILRTIAQNDPSGETDLIFNTFLEKGSN